jgi:hypothetical protein
VRRNVPPHQAGSFCSHVDAVVAYADSKDHRFIESCQEKGMYLTFYGLLDEGGAVKGRRGDPAELGGR